MGPGLAGLPPAGGMRQPGMPQTSQRPRIIPGLKRVYWNIRKRPQRIRHLLDVAAQTARSAVRLFRASKLRADRRPVLAIALLEHMGDIVAAEPIARFARQRYPGMRIFWITRPAYAPLAAEFPGVDEVLTVSCLTEWALLWRLRLVRTVWDLHFSERCCPLCDLPLAKHELPSMEDYFSHGSLLENQCLCAGIQPLSGAPILPRSAAAAAVVDRLNLPPRFIAVHCKSSDDCKDWPVECWRELVAEIRSRTGLAVVEVGIEPVLQNVTNGQVHSLCGSLSMIETAEVLRRATLFIGVDSGPAHLANSVGTRGIVLLGKYRHFVRYLPFSGGYADGSNADLIYAEGAVASLPLPYVLDAALRRI